VISNLRNADYKIVAIATLVGLLIGVLLGSTLLLKYKSTALVRISLGASEIKTFVEITKNPEVLEKFMQDQNLGEEQNTMYKILLNTVTSNVKWIEPILKIGKQEAKDLGVDMSKQPSTNEIVGLQITATHRDPAVALSLVKLQTNYALQAQLKDSLEKWVFENEKIVLGRLERYESNKLTTLYEIAAIQTRLKEFKRVMQEYPETSRIDAKPFLSLEKGSERYLPIPNQMSVLELRLVDIKEQIARDEREKKRDEVILNLAKQIGSSKLRETRIAGWLDDAIQITQSKLASFTDERERIAGIDALNSFYAMRLSYIDGVNYILPARIADRPEQPRPLIVAIIFALLGLLSSFAWVARHKIIRFFESLGQEPLALPYTPDKQTAYTINK
jgi:hypothetical protein